MALATRCPHCHTTFRVAHDQLKLRAGLVRCGACKEIFNGIEHLLPQEAVNAAPQAPQVPLPSPPPTSPQAPHAADTPETPSESTTAQAPATAIPSAELPVTVAQQEAESIEAPAREIADAPGIDATPEQRGETETAPAAAPSPAPQAPARREADTDDIPDFSEFLQLAEEAAQDSPPRTPSKRDDVALPPEPVAQAEAEKVEPAAHADTHVDDDPLTRMTLMDFHERQDGFPDTETDAKTDAHADKQPTDDGVDALEETIDELRKRPDRRKLLPRRPRNMQRSEEDEAADAIDAIEEGYDLPQSPEVEEPSFVTKARRRERFGPIVTWALAIGSMLLILTLLGQGIYMFRNQLAARLPKAKPALVKVCVYLNCRVTLPMQIDTISIEANELQSTGAAKDTFVLNTILRNRSSVTQAWPNLELTLKDANGKPTLRRVFLPREYLLDPQDVDRGFAPSTEQQIKLVFSVSQPDSSGYEVAIFYP